MKKLVNLMLTAGFVLGCTVIGQSQIRFKLALQADRKTYIVSMVPDRTYEHPDNIISTAQVTFKVATKADFLPSSFTTSNPQEKWMRNSLVQAPELAPSYDYYSYGLETMGSSNYELRAGKETALFSFQSLGDGEVKLELIDNEDIMAKSVKKTHINLANQISLLGFEEGLGNAYGGNVKDNSLITSNEFAQQITIDKVYPNPIVEKAGVEWTNSFQGGVENLVMVVVEGGTGKVWKEEPLPAKRANTGRNCY